MMNGVEYLGGGGGGGNVDDVYVNGESVLDENKIAQITSYKEVTQSEYEALPASKLNDGIAYFISDSVEAEGFPPLIYSINEREVGVWKDGRPLYQKTFTTTPSGSANEVRIYHGISTLRECVKFEGHLYYTSNPSSSNRFLPQLYRTEIEGYSASVYNVTNEFIQIPYGDWLKGQASNFTIDVTIWYTKTTDTAGSGIWAGNGAMAHHYSTDEVIVGTWTDGKPIYEKIRTVQNPTKGGEDWNYLEDYNIETLVSVRCITEYNQGEYGNENLIEGKNQPQIRIYNGGLYYYVASTTNMQSFRVFLQYTKTTD